MFVLPVLGHLPSLPSYPSTMPLLGDYGCGEWNLVNQVVNLEPPVGGAGPPGLYPPQLTLRTGVDTLAEATPVLDCRVPSRGRKRGKGTLQSLRLPWGQN